MSLQLSDTVSKKSDFMAYGLQRDYSPAWEFTLTLNIDMKYNLIFFRYENVDKVRDKLNCE